MNVTSAASGTTAAADATPLDYTFVCRTCLVSEAEFYMVTAPVAIDECDDEDGGGSKLSFLECLRYCTRLEDLPELPAYICTECSASLQVAYNFIRNALEAHEILRQKLCAGGHQRRNNGVLRDCDEKYTTDDAEGGRSSSSKMRYRCKLCNEKVETKKALKEHVKLHLDIISYCCQMCSFECKKRSELSEHYVGMHNAQPTREQLKPQTAMPMVDAKEESEVEQDDEIYQQMEQIHNAPKRQGTQKSPPEATLPQEASRVMLNQGIDASGALAATTIAAENLNALRSELKYDEQFNSISANEMSVGNEFIVMADGTVEEVMANGVVIEYINAAEDGVTLENGLVLDNVVQVEAAEAGQVAVNSMDMDVDDMIIEELIGGEVTAKTTTEQQTTVQTLENIEDELPPPSIITLNNLKRLKCKICASNFLTQEHLKTHMLTHNEIPHFFCDQCAFYTFFKIDLTQHYKTKHKLQPTQKQLQPKNKVKPLEFVGDLKHVYACDLCLYETNQKAHLRRHYLSQHQEEATEVQLRPTIVDETDLMNQSCTTAPPSPPKRQIKPLRPDYPKGLNCKKCSKTFFWRNKLKDHYKQHSLEEGRVMDGMRAPAASTTSLLKQNSTAQYALQNSACGPSNYNTVVVAPANMVAAQRNMTETATATEAAPAPAPDIIMDIPTTAADTATAAVATLHPQSGAHSHTALGYACMQIPSDAIPQVVETDTTIDHHDLGFVLNDELFEDFDDDVNDDENDEEDSTEFQDLQLTSEDDFEDMLEEQQQQQQSLAEEGEAEQKVYQPYCVHCNKKFMSQYQFENHMFVHRGLAPYRCEMCTNLYNTKRALIRHYKAVHKKMPTRDMIQAKGDKVSADRTPVEHLNLAEQKAITLMCAKCPYESTELQNLHIHLNTIHGVADESYILQKLPFECPRCIRSYASKTRLIRHLERSHSVATIIQQHRSPTTTTTMQSAITTDTSTSSRCGLNIIIQTQMSSNNDNYENGANPEHEHEHEHEQVLTVSDIMQAPIESAVATAAPTSSSSLSLLMPQPEASTDDMPHSNCADVSALASAAAKTNKTAKFHSCDICHLSWPKVSALHAHLAQVHQHQPLLGGDVGDLRERLFYNFKCDICGGTYKSLDLLKHHIKRHTARIFRCSSCPKTYINRCELKNHERSHTGEMPHQCDKCTKKFRYAHHLKRHRDVAHLGRRFLCPTEGCERIFTTQAQLRIHAWSHSGHVPYRCKYCGRSFKKRESLRQHTRKLHHCNLTEAEIAENFRENVGYTNPHDLTVSASNGAMLRRSEAEAAGASEAARQDGVRVEQSNNDIAQHDGDDDGDNDANGPDIHIPIASAQLGKVHLDHEQMVFDAELQLSNSEVDKHDASEVHVADVTLPTYLLHGIVDSATNLAQFFGNDGHTPEHF